MRKSFRSITSRRRSRCATDPDCPDGRHAPGARSRITLRRTRGVATQPTIILDLANRPPVLPPEIEAIERHLADLLDEFFG